MALNEKLQETLSLIGDTPVKEPELFRMLNDPTLKKSVTLQAALDRAELKLTDFTGMEIAEFGRALGTKIAGFKDADGNFKQTSATENCQLPNFLEAEEIAEAGRVLNMAQTKLQSVGEDSEALKEALSDYAAALTTMRDVAWPVSRIDKEKLNEDEAIAGWEEELVLTQVFEATLEIEKTVMGKR